MIYSVWNQGLGAFDYYESSEVQASVNIEKPAHLKKRQLGSTIDQAAWPLPVGARHVGFGEAAVGKVATKSRAAALGDSTDGSISLLKAGLLVAAAALAWKYMVKAPHRRTS